MNDANNAGTPGELFYRPNRFDDWGYIRTADGEIFAVVRRPLDDEEADRHRRDKTDPFEPLARALMSALSTPNAPVEQREAIARELPRWLYGVADEDEPDEWDKLVSSQKLPFLYAADAILAVIKNDSIYLNFFEQNLGMELSCSWEDSDGPWEVHNVTGGRNDREWTKVGQGKTPREAISCAIRNGGKRP